MSTSPLGTGMAAEMAEQPAVLAAFSGRRERIADDIREVAGGAAAGVVFLARGSSDNAALLGDQPAVDRAAEVLVPHRRLAVVARGLCYAAAKETGLKLREATGTMAHGFSADLRHSPIAVSGPQAPALLMAGSGPADTHSLPSDLASRGRRVCSSARAPTPTRLSRRATALSRMHPGTICGRQFALAMCRALDVDPDAPPA
jgi:glucosamine--fructose-6-phosphate aminotransferase (isomerizing)